VSDEIEWAIGNQCLKKKRFRNRESAENALKITKRIVPEADAKRLHVYRCNYCKAFHIGKVKKGKGRAK
jgi:hypothetical protein